MVLLTKGFEVEMYTGTAAGDVVGLSHRIVRDLPGFMLEPDQRNVEYATEPLTGYDDLLCALVHPRCQLRRYLKTLGDYTLIPGSALALEHDTARFLRSDPDNPYHARIEAQHGTRVVTSSIHINFGIAEAEDIIKACRLLRLEAPVVLALSASSPFFNGEVSGAHSTRWLRFPRTPEQVPLFLSHAHYIDWVEEQLQLGTMFNVRHLWSSVRPNGADRPYRINRAELRIADLIASPPVLLGMTALVETRLLALLAGEIPDPLAGAFTPAELVEMADRNERAAAADGLDARLIDWQTGRESSVREWTERWLVQAAPVAAERGFERYLPAVESVLAYGSEADRWLAAYRTGVSIRTILQQAARRLEAEEAELRARLCVGAPLPC
jgi:predicted glutamate--cysteine ligase